jgi:hypothetical protein
MLLNLGLSIGCHGNFSGFDKGSINKSEFLPDGWKIGFKQNDQRGFSGQTLWQALK